MGSRCPSFLHEGGALLPLFQPSFSGVGMGPRCPSFNPFLHALPHSCVSRLYPYAQLKAKSPGLDFILTLACVQRIAAGRRALTEVLSV